MWNDDGWDNRFRLGIITPHADICPEVEMQAMAAQLPITYHSARVDFSPMHPGGLIDEKIGHVPVQDFTAADSLDPVVEGLSNSPLDVIALAFTSSSFKLGVDGEQALIRRLSGVSHGIPTVTTGMAAISAMHKLSVSKVAVMAPSWFDRELCAEGRAYFAAAGIDVATVEPSGPLGGPPAINPEATAKAARSYVADTHAECLFIAGNGHRAVGAIEALEEELAIPVLTANQVLLWAALKGTDLSAKISGYGSLFKQKP